MRHALRTVSSNKPGIPSTSPTRQSLAAARGVRNVFGRTLLCCGRRGYHGYSGSGLADAVNRLFIVADVKDDEGRRPRVHDPKLS